MSIISKYFSEFSEKQIRQFEDLKPMYEEWNAKINVISRKDIDNFYERHVLHSLSIACIEDFAPGSRIIDIGCGGGFPSVPLAIFFPEVEFVAVDSINKKLVVLMEIAKAIGLENITCKHSRAEDIKGTSFDFAISRAVAPLKELWHWAKPLIHRSGNEEIKSGLICLKGGDLAQEISESNTRPRIFTISDIFHEPYFAEKYIVCVDK